MSADVSDANENSTENWMGKLNKQYHILAKKFLMFLPCPETLSEADFKGSRLTWQRKFHAEQYSHSDMDLAGLHQTDFQ